MTDYLNIEVPATTKIVVVGDIHEHEEQFDKMVERIKPSKDTWLVSLGDVIDKGFGIKVAESIIDKMRVLEYQGFAYAVRANHELKHIRKAKKNRSLMTKQLEWFRKQPLGLSFKFNNGTRLTVVHAGITHRHTWEDLEKNSEVCYVRTLDKEGDFIPLIWKEDKGVKYLEPAKPGGITWHKSYDGRFGYVAAGHDPQDDGIAKFYEHSCNLDTSVFTTGKLTAQIFSQKGLEDLVVVEGTPRNPENIGEIRK